MNYTKVVIVYLIINGRKLIQISMELWKVDLNLEILKGYFFNADIRLVDESNNAETVYLSFQKATLLKLDRFHFFFQNAL